MFAGLLGAGVSSLISGLFHYNDRSNMDKELQRRQDEFRTQIDSMRSEATQQGDQLNSLAQQRFNTDPIREISGIVDSYKASDWNKYLQQEAAQSVEGLAADQGLLQSPRGMQMIQNQSALAASQGMSEYVKESLQRRSDLDKQGISLMDQRNQTLNSARNSSMTAYQNMLSNYNNFAIERSKEISGPNIFDAAANSFAGFFTRSLMDRYSNQYSPMTYTPTTRTAPTTRTTPTTEINPTEINPTATNPQQGLLLRSPQTTQRTTETNKNQGLSHLFGPIYYKP